MIKAYAEKARDQKDFSEVRVVGMDETAARRGHDYVTLFVDLEEKKDHFCHRWKGSKSAGRLCHGSG